MEFLKSVTKDLQKSGIQVGSSEPPRYWFSTGNHVLNKIISGSYLNGIPQGRIVAFTGPSGTGKSFLACNIIREAQAQGAIVIVLDTENALDDGFVGKIGVDFTNNYVYVPINTMEDCKKTVSAFIRAYKKEYGDDKEAPKVLMVIDSVDMMMTETEEDHFDKGESRGDQGQRNKRLKAMLREFVHAIKHLNMSMVINAQVYKNQDIKNGEGVWIVSEAIKFSLSQIIMLTKLKLKDTSTNTVYGIRMKCEGYKTRFTQPFQNVTIEVPYETGMNKFNGLLDVAKDIGVVESKGAWYNITGQPEKWYAKNVTEEQLSYILTKCEENCNVALDANISEDEIDSDDSLKESIKQMRIKNMEKKRQQEDDSE
jgi:recombination protein RecA